MSYGKAWTAEEDARMLALRKQGKAQREIGEALGRSIHSVTSRMHALRVTTPSPRATRSKIKQRKCMCCGAPFQTQENYRLCARHRAQSISPYAI